MFMSFKFLKEVLLKNKKKIKKRFVGGQEGERGGGMGEHSGDLNP
jgi:hypothetical protein